MTTVALASAAALSACSVQPRPGSVDGLPPGLTQLSASVSRAALHPFGPGTAALGGGFAQYARGQASFTDALHGWLAAQIRNPLIQVRFVERPTSALLDTGGHTYKYSFFLHDRALLDTDLSASELAGREPLALGNLPVLRADAAAAASTVWPEADAAQAAVTRELPAQGVAAEPVYEKVTQVYYLSGGRALPALLMTVLAGGLRYHALSDGLALIKLRTAYFDVDGTAKIFLNNINDAGGLVTYPLTGLAADGTLTSQYLQTFLPDGTARATEPSEVFNYPASDPRFDEVMAFAHTDDHVKWMLGLGAQTYGDLPLHLELHQLPGGTPNNALFMPGDVATGAPFQIILGDGDGYLLQNLATDRDVPSHESGHYVIYNYLKATSGESLVLHEGLADALVFLQQDNSCLGKSICPAGSPACIVAGQCLRTADNKWGYLDATWQEWTSELGGKFGHKHGQVISGLLWDLNKSHTLPLKDLTMMTLKTISYFHDASGLRDFLLAMLTADKEMFGCKYDGAIRGFMHARNLDALIGDVPAGCNAIPALTGRDSSLGAGGTTTDTSAAKTTKKGSLFGCGAIGGAGAPLSALALILGLALPLLLGQRRQRAPVPVKARRAIGPTARGGSERTPPG